MNVKRILKKIYRFVEIDVQYFKTSLPFTQKITDVMRTDFRLISNVLQKSQSFSPVKIGKSPLHYDTIYATKTLLTTVYDFYTELVITKLLPA